MVIVFTLHYSSISPTNSRNPYLYSVYEKKKVMEVGGVTNREERNILKSCLPKCYLIYLIKIYLFGLQNFHVYL